MFEVRLVTGRDNDGTTYGETRAVDGDQWYVPAHDLAREHRGAVDVFRSNLARPASRIARVYVDGGIDRYV